MSQFQVGDKIEVLDVEGIAGADSWLTKGKRYEVTDVYSEYIFILDNANESFRIDDDEFHCIKKIPSQEVAEDLAQKLDSALKENAKLKEHNQQLLSKSEMTKQPVTINNQLRKQLINKARNEIDEYIKYQKNHNNTVKFNVNFKKGTVEVQVFDNKNINICGGFAKCSNDDVFNVHIGKVIALYKANKLIVPQRYISAIQPDVLVKGLDIRILGDSNAKY